MRLLSIVDNLATWWQEWFWLYSFCIDTCPHLSRIFMLSSPLQPTALPFFPYEGAPAWVCPSFWMLHQLSNSSLVSCYSFYSFSFTSSFFSAVGVYSKTLTILVKKDLKIFGIFYFFVFFMFCSAIFMALKASSRSIGFSHADVR